MFLEVNLQIAGIFQLCQLISVNHIVQVKNRASDTITALFRAAVSYFRLIVHVHQTLNTQKLKRLKQ